MNEPDRLSAALTESGPDLLAYFLRRVERDDAADLLGETMVTAWRRVGDLPVEAEPGRMWLFGVARGVLRNYARGKRRQRALADRLRDRLHQEVVPPADQGVDVRDAIERLPSELAEIVRLVHWERLTLVECSSLLGIPASPPAGATNALANNCASCSIRKRSERLPATTDGPPTTALRIRRSGMRPHTTKSDTTCVSRNREEVGNASSNLRI